MGSFDPRRWLDMPPKIERHGQLDVVRDDMIEGGSKLRFLPFLCEGADEIVYGGPFCGGAPYALSVLGRESNKRITLFFAKRKKLHPRQRRALQNGAVFYQVPMGFMSNVQAKARAYTTAQIAAGHNTRFLPLGFDVPAAEEPFVEVFSQVRKRHGSPARVWCATGSGMLARCLGRGFPDSEVVGIAVGLKSKHGGQAFPENVRLIDAKLPFERETKAAAPFPSDGNYDRKAWEIAAKQGKRGDLFWNVLG